MKIINIKFIPIYILTLLTFSTQLLATNSSTKLIKQTLNYLKETQQNNGQWPSYMEVDKSFPFLGFKGKKAYDANMFVTGQIYLHLWDLKDEYYNLTYYLLKKAYTSILLFKNNKNDSFHFWMLQPPRKHLSILSPYRRASHFRITFPLFNYAENVPFDSDDTALGHLIYAKHKQIDPYAKELSNEKKFYQYVDEYRDSGRNSINLYNFTHGRLHPTGAYLTWFARERGFRKDFVPKRKQTYLPIGANDLDCAVNANILRTLAHLNQLRDSLGTLPSCTYINRMIKLRDEKRCGIYYPNKSAIYLAIMNAYQEGADCLRTSSKLIVKRILNTQHKDGHWNGPRNSKGRDQIHTTALNLLGLLEYKKTEKLYYDKKINESIKLGLQFILQNTQTTPCKNNPKKLCSSWPSGIFFTGGTIVRKNIVWRSRPYTTSLILKVLKLSK